MRAPINGIDIHYELFGPAEGTPTVFIHGFPFSSAMWKPQVLALADRFRLVAYDVRGHGASGAGDGQCTMDLFVDDLLGLMDHLKIGKAVLCGLSMGGYIALRAVERNPERVAGLVLCDTKSEPDANEHKVRRAAQMKRIKAEGTAAFAEEFVKSVFAPESFAARRDAVEAVKAVIRGNPPLGVCGALLAMAARTDTSEALADVRVPTLVMAGEKDVLTTPAAACALAERIPGATCVLLPGAAHLSNLENPEEFNRRLAEFLRAGKW